MVGLGRVHLAEVISIKVLELKNCETRCEAHHQEH